MGGEQHKKKKSRFNQFAYCRNNVLYCMWMFMVQTVVSCEAQERERERGGYGKWQVSLLLFSFIQSFVLLYKSCISKSVSAPTMSFVQFACQCKALSPIYMNKEKSILIIHRWTVCLFVYTIAIHAHMSMALEEKNIVIVLSKGNGKK